MGWIVETLLDLSAAVHVYNKLTIKYQAMRINLIVYNGAEFRYAVMTTLQNLCITNDTSIIALTDKYGKTLENHCPGNWGDGVLG